MSAGAPVELTIPAASPRPRIILGVLLAVAVGCLVAAVALLVSSGLGHVQELVAAVAVLTGVVAGAPALLLLRTRRRGAARVVDGPAGVTFVATNAVAVFCTAAGWGAIPLVVVAARAVLGLLDIHYSLAPIALTGGVLLSIYAIIWEPRVGCTDPQEPWVALGRDGVTVQLAQEPTRVIRWGELGAPCGRQVLTHTSGLPGPVLDNSLGSDPQVVAAAIEHFRTHPADRRLLTDTRRTADHLERLHPRT